MKTANGVVILVLGIISFVPGFMFLTGIPAWIMGNSALRDIDAGLADPNERSMVSIGRVLGIVATALSVIGLCCGLAFFFGMLGIFGLTAAGASQGTH